MSREWKCKDCCVFGTDACHFPKRSRKMNEEILGLYVMELANLQMNYHIMSTLVKQNNPILEEWKHYIDDLEVELEQLKEQIE